MVSDVNLHPYTVEGIRAQASGALRSLCVYHPDVYKTGNRSELVRGAGEAKKLIQFQMAPAMASPQYAALLEQLVYDLYDMVVRAKAFDMPRDLVVATATANDISGGIVEAGAPVAPVELTPEGDYVAAAVDSPSRDLSPAHRINNARRSRILHELLEHASEEQKTQVKSAFLSLSVFTKRQLIENGGLYLLVALVGGDAARALVYSVSAACKSDDAPCVMEYCAALAGLANPQEQQVNQLLVKVVPDLVRVCAQGSAKGKEEAAGGLRAVSVVSFNAKVAIAEAGAFAPLVKLLGEGTNMAKEEAAGALWRLLSMMTESQIEVRRCRLTSG